jgi:uncharacterized phage protein gp47/JayE
MAGVTNTGFVQKRFPEVLEDLRAQAIPLFQDLATPGDPVDTSDSTALGRLIGLTAPAITEVWEAAQEVYAAFDPNTATGIALDNLVALGGVVRADAAPTTISCLVWGDTYTEIPSGSIISGANATVQFASTQGLELDVSTVSGVVLSIPTVTVGETYYVTLSSYAGLHTISTVAVGGDTAATIFSRLSSQLTSVPIYAASVSASQLKIQIVAHYSAFDILLPLNITASKVAKRLEFSCLVEGPTAVTPNTVTTIVTPVLGWDSVNNPIPAVVGTDKESDEELRERFRSSKYLRAQNTSDALYSALLELDGVTELRLYVNTTDAVDSIGLDPHSFLVLIVGGDATEIARVIWKHTPIGIASKGAQTVTIRDVQGYEQVVRFDRPTYVPIWAEVNITTDSTFPVGGEDKIKQDLSDYITANQGTGDKVVYSRLFGAVNQTPGHEIVTLKIRKSGGTLTETTLTMAHNEIATLPIANITIV